MGTGAKFENAPNSAGHQQVGDALGGFGGNAQDRQLDLPGRDGLSQRIDRLDGQPIMFLPDFAGIVIKQGDDVETAGPESPISEQGAAEIAQSHHRQRPIVVDAEDVPGRRSTRRSGTRCPDGRTDRRTRGPCEPGRS